ncbi:AAA domain-containing protein [uncultured Fibrobacter sp.]|uniref:AAA domain-containing protein n=1 Tax=uncultured Fibrobacter sp. TaxID=261512 RepID=UPI0028063F77|nr:AAA domain-containing protein [uncultured Fibrobacter sp.]
MRTSKKSKLDSLIFPFGCNNSQFAAVKTAMENQISIIQGPPGTGKTQTILNIIANLLMQEKSVLVVSNNNDATKNVYEKLSSEKYGLGFICAFHGKSENIKHFLQTQTDSYPAYLAQWTKSAPTFLQDLDFEVKKLADYFNCNEQIALIEIELAAIRLEEKYFNSFEREEYNREKIKNLPSSKLMRIFQKLQFIYSEKEKFGFFTKMYLKLKFKIGNRRLRDTNPETVLHTIKAQYYQTKAQELTRELHEKSDFVKSFDPDAVYKKCLEALQYKVAVCCAQNKSRHIFKDSAEIWKNPAQFAKEYPVVLSTTFSSRATIGSGDEFLFDYVIMDEASQVDVVTGALALSCAKNAVIVGDKMQLPNIIEENKKPLVQEIFVKANIPEGYNYLHSFLSSLELILPETPQTLLREHYRCHPKIIQFCNRQFYGGKLLVMTKDNDEKDVLTAIKTVPGNFCKERYNQRQIDVIKEEVLPKFSREEIKSLGIIAPYNNQTDAINNQIRGIDAATVHKYQGRERDCIIISTVDNEITPFADNSNMLNVAISRAKKKLVVVLSGNTHRENSNLVALLKYIEYNNFKVENSKVNSIFDFLYTQNSRAKFEYLQQMKKISQFDSENAMNDLLTKLFEKQEYSKFGFVFEMPLKDVVGKNEMTKLSPELLEFANKSWSHVDFIVYNKVTKEILFGIEVDGYNYHKKGTKQAERDLKKNEIFRQIGLPLLRLNTKGSNEKETIEKMLK